MPEQAFRFGRAGHLMGVAGAPSAAAAAGSVGVIVLNAGLVHRVGPFRLHVEMTRRLNACGYPTLRFDLSTLGDSGASGESQSGSAQTCADVADAMSLLAAESGCARFVLIGLCSGAMNAHRVALSDTRVAGAVFLDGYAYRTPGFHVRHSLRRLRHPSSIARFLARRLRPALADFEPAFDVVPPPLAQVRRELADMLGRGLRLYFIYSGGVSSYFNHQRQFRECFGHRISRQSAVAWRYLEHADHTYILTADRLRLLELVEHWLQQNFPVIPASAHS